MANIARNLAIGLMFVIIVPSQALNTQDMPELDTSKVGVKDGDSFTYVVLWNSAFNPNYSELTTWNQEVGAEFTINIVNATPIYEKSWDIKESDRNYLQTEIEFENGTVLEDEALDAIGNWIVFPDWVYWEFVETEVVNAIPSSEHNITYKVSSQITNGPEVYTSKLNITTIALDITYGGNYTTYAFTEIKYDKATGMLLYLGAVYDHTTQGGKQIQYWEIAYVQKGYEDYELPAKVADQEGSKVADSTSSSLISNFSLITSFSSLIIIFTVIRYRKH